jgi:hypothetical protein
MAYATKYQLKFLSRKAVALTVDLALKDYSGAVIQLEGAADPCLINYESGDEQIINPIRASVCTLNFFNNGTSPLTAFYSEDDEAWKVTVLEDSTAEIIWQGFLLQDSCSELFQDAPDQVQLKATDNLALLKDITFSEAWNETAAKTLYESGTRPVVIHGDLKTIDITEPLIVTSEDVSKINLLFIYDTFYTVLDASYVPATHILTIEIVETFAAAITDPAAYYELYTINPALDTFPLFTYLKVALQRTGIALPLEIYSNLYENSEDDKADVSTADMFQQTHLFSGMFINDSGEWDNVYSILETILFPLNATLQQTRGRWNVVRWPELSLFVNNSIEGTLYDETFENPSLVLLAPNISVAIGSNMVFINADAERSILRPFKHVKFIYNYEQPKELIKNINLQIKGNQIGESTDGTHTIKNYQLPYWTPLDTSNPVAPDEIYLQVVLTPTPGTSDIVETDRYIVIAGGDIGGPWLQSSEFPLDIKDRVNVSFSLKTRFSNPGNASLTFVFQTDTGTTKYKMNWANPPNANGSWTTTGGARFIWTTTTDLQTDWITFAVESLAVPVAGMFSIMLDQADDNFGGETYYKDFKVEYFPLINNSLQIKGQFHKQLRDINNKNILEKEIKIDDSPKLALKGALLTSATSGGNYLTLTKSWHRSHLTESRRLGQLTTMEREQMQSVPRTILEGTIDHDRPYVSIMNVLQVDTLPNLNFIFGVTEINLMEGLFRATLWEIHKGTAEADAAMQYFFDYIYEVT